MLLTGDQVNYLYATDERQRPTANPFARWPNATLFYEFDKSLDQRGRSTVADAMRYIANVSCVRFVERREDDWQQRQQFLLIKQGSGCSSGVGPRRDGPQRMIIDGNLCTRGSVIHELLHGLGILHMHASSGRDEFVDINWDNVKDGAQLNFKPFTTDIGMYGTDFDYDSIMSYGRFAFAKNKSVPTIVAKRTGAGRMGQRKGNDNDDHGFIFCLFLTVFSV
jgi:hypothetical protein